MPDSPEIRTVEFVSATWGMIVRISFIFSDIPTNRSSAMVMVWKKPGACPPSRGSGDAGGHRVGLILAWANFYHFPALLSIYLFKSVPLHFLHGSGPPRMLFCRRSRLIGAAFPLIVFLPRSARHEFYGSRNDISITIVHYKQMNVVWCDHIIQDR